MKGRQRLPKTERLHSRKLVNKLFGGNGRQSMSAYPLRLVYKVFDTLDPCQMLISVPKRCLHRANKRNLVKRQVREAYRKHKDIIAGNNMAIAFIWQDSKTYPSEIVENTVVSLLTRVSEKIALQKEKVE